MSILVTRKNSSALRRWSLGYLLAAFLVFLFGMLYERFSHNVYSAFMACAFAFPLAGGTLSCLLLNCFGKSVMPGKLPLNLYAFGISTLTTGSIVKGVLEIYGTTNQLVIVYWCVGAGLMVAAVALYIAAIAWRRL